MEVHYGFAKYELDIINEWTEELEGPTEYIDIKELKCSNSAAVNLVLTDLGRTVSEEQGLKHLTINYFMDRNDLQESTLEQLALKCHSL